MLKSANRSYLWFIPKTRTIFSRWITTKFSLILFTISYFNTILTIRSTSILIILTVFFCLTYNFRTISKCLTPRFLISLSNNPSTITISTFITTYRICIIRAFWECDTIFSITSTHFRIDLTFFYCSFFDILALWKSDTSLCLIYPKTGISLIILYTISFSVKIFTLIEFVSTSLSSSYAV